MNICEWLEQWSVSQSVKPAIVFDGVNISYGELNRLTRLAASVLQHNFNITSGDRVAFLGANSPDMLVFLFACARLGAIFVPLNWRLAAPEIAYALQDSDPKVLFCDEDYRKNAEKACEGSTGDPILIVDSRFKLMKAHVEGEYDAIHEGPHSPLLIVYTSGTTGQPKGAVLTHQSLICNAENSVFMHGMVSEDTIFTNLPMYHVGGLNIQTIPALSVGATIILHPRFDLEETIKVINESQPTLMILVPALMAVIMSHPDWLKLDFSSLRAITTGSTKVPVPLIEAYQNRGIPVIQVYGSTETAPTAIHQTIEMCGDSLGSIGVPAVLSEAKILDAGGKLAGIGKKGEIVVRGPNLFSGYWNDPEGTAEVLRDGWFYTGDIGHVDENGWYFVDDRIKDVIISGSENIYPAELERILDGCDAVAESAVIGRLDKKWGEVPVAFVVPRKGATISYDEINELFVGSLANFKHPREVIVVSELPRNTMGKILKFKLRKMLRERVVDQEIPKVYGDRRI